MGAENSMNKEQNECADVCGPTIAKRVQGSAFWEGFTCGLVIGALAMMSLCVLYAAVAMQ